MADTGWRAVNQTEDIIFTVFRLYRNSLHPLGQCQSQTRNTRKLETMATAQELASILQDNSSGTRTLPANPPG